MSLTCAITITTRNRLDDLRRTVEVIGKLDPPPDEIFICTDGCTDGTVEYVKTLPRVHLIVNERPRGSIGSRDTMIRQLKSDIILSFDDDSYPVEPDFLRSVSSLFESAPQLAVATFPQYSDEFPETLSTTDFGPTHLVASFANSSAAIRRTVYFQVGGYPALFHHVYEEPDFALRCIAAGFEARYETSLHVRHHYSGVQRNEVRVHHFQARNELWSVFMRCPIPWLFAVAPFRLLRQFQYACRRGISWVMQEPAWWISFLAGLPECLAQRKPVPWKHYRRWMMLLHDPVPLPGTTVDAPASHSDS